MVQGIAQRKLTSGQFHISEVLPFVHGDKPCVALATATQIDHEL